MVVSSSLLSYVTLKAIAAKEEFADVSANSVIKHELATWVLVYELFNVENQIVKNDDFTALQDEFVKLTSSHDLQVACRSKRHCSIQELSVQNLEDSERDHEESNV
jgi:hypothetical protein